MPKPTDRRGARRSRTDTKPGRLVGPDDDRNSALRKAVAVLRGVIAEGHGISAAELASRLHLPRQTVHRTVRALEDMRFVTRAAGRDRYEVGPALIDLSQQTLMSSYRQGPWRAVLEQLVAQTGESCNLAALDGHRVFYMHRLNSLAPIRVHLDIGTHGPLHCTAIGKVLLAYMPEEARRRLLRAMRFERYTENTITDRHKLDAEASIIREQGYASTNQELIEGIVALGVPVFNPQDEVIAGLAIYAPVLRASPDDLRKQLPTLRAAADKLRAIQRESAPSPSGKGN
jgi:IclR family acetate operon transcriptional repressor